LALAKSATVIYACPCADPSKASLVYFEEVGIDYRPAAYSPQDSIRTIIGSTLRLKPFKFHKYGNRAAVRAFSQQLHSVDPDAIICFHAHMLEMGEMLRKIFGWDVPILLREHNIEYELVDNYRASLPFPKKLVTWIFAWLTRRAEQAGWRRADATLFLSDRDYDMATNTGFVSNAVLAREGVPIPSPRDLTVSSESRNLLLLLNPKAIQSVANLDRFLQEYWRSVAHLPAMSGVSLAITGVTPERLAKLTAISVAQQADLRIDALGFLPNLLPAFNMSTALISPTFVGGGIRKKILEGMAHQLPVIATDLDIQTCTFFEPSKNIIRLGNTQDFVKTVGLLCNDRRKWHQITRAGRETVEKFANWEGFGAVVIEEAQRLRALRGPHGDCVGPKRNPWPVTVL
jgi:glycosyltransferase involved in cell wall biosynthesis